jgi:uncharacterized protein HemY
MLEFIDDQPAPAAVVESKALSAFQQAGLAMRAGRMPEADSLLKLATREHRSDQGPFFAAIIMNHAFVAYHSGDYPKADSLGHRAIALGAQSADGWALMADLAVLRNDRGAAVAALRQCLLMNPNHAEGRRLAGALGLLPARR